MIDTHAETPWHGVLAAMGVKSGDGRMFADNALTFRKQSPQRVRKNVSLGPFRTMAHNGSHHDSQR